MKNDVTLSLYEIALIVVDHLGEIGKLEAVETEVTWHIDRYSIGKLTATFTQERRKKHETGC